MKDSLLHICGRRVSPPGLGRLCVALLLGCAFRPAPPAAAQEPAALFGRVTDERDAPVQGVMVTLRGLTEPAVRRSVVTDAGGQYRLMGLRPGRYLLRADRLGYLGGEERELALAPGERRRYDLRLSVDTLRVEGVLVQGRRDRERQRFESDPGLTARVVGGPDLKTLPGLAEADVLRAVELLPGVVSTSDFSSAFNVRGGSADQNLILLDGFPIFNPFHLGGLFSVFNADAIARAELLAGGFGAEFGGRVSSVLNVESQPAKEPGLEVDAAVSLLAARLLLRSSLPDGVARSLGADRGSWLVSARRSYFDQLLRPLVDFPYHLTDVQAFATLDTDGGGSLALTGYAGGDVLDLSNYRPRGTDEGSLLRVRWSWGNRVVGARWTQPLGESWVGTARLGYSAFSEDLRFPDFGDVHFASAVDQWTLRADLARKWAERAELRVGSGLERLRHDNLAQAGGTEFFAGDGAGTLLGTYASLRWRPGERWLLEPGLRLDTWMGEGSTQVHAAPRLAVKRFLGGDTNAAVKLAVGRYTQFLHSLRNEELPVSNDTWVLAGESVPTVVSDQAQLGVEGYWGDFWSASAEVYLRTFRGVTEFNFADDPNDPADDLLSGRGRSYGLDLLLRRRTERFSGWVSLSLLRAQRTLPDPLATGWEEIPPELTFAPVFDRRLDVDLVAQYRFPRDVEFGARWNYGSPLPYTRPVAQHFAWRHSTLFGGYEPGDRRGPSGPPLYVVLGPRNAERYPPYHRLDLTLRRTFRPRWGSWTPFLQVLNVYNRRDNVLFYFYNYDRQPPTRSGISMFPVLPALGVEVSF